MDMVRLVSESIAKEQSEPTVFNVGCANCILCNRKCDHSGNKLITDLAEVDNVIFFDVGLDDVDDNNGEPPLWLCDEQVWVGIKGMLQLDRCDKEDTQLWWETMVLWVWFGEEWQLSREVIERTGPQSQQSTNIIYNCTKTNWSTSPDFGPEKKALLPPWGLSQHLLLQCHTEAHVAARGEDWHYGVDNDEDDEEDEYDKGSGSEEEDFKTLDLGRYQEAEPLDITVLDKQKQLFGADHPDTFFAMANLAVTYRKLGRYQEAEPLEVTVLDKRKQLFGMDHPNTFFAMANLAVTYRKLGRYQEAEPLEVTVLDKRKQLFGMDHPNTLLAMGNLAVTYRELGRYQEAELLEVTVLDKRKQLFGMDHPNTLTAMANLAATYRELGRYQEAEPLQITVLEKRKPLFGADHPDTLHAMANLAATYYRLGRYQEAEPLEKLSLLRSLSWRNKKCSLVLAIPTH
ncbi:hypothetical protein DFH08DRAFT_1050302 [Mycena albidolilacea]|uniref:Kinesin light chain n=1 Tax=Mycena albidolilacea TaxID=1033008 RepID=A0AAD7EBF3_9AGAR|nr:hypothetical protein DFH08DRAFT_1050302 [Mycena albidolilacea]